MQTIKTRSGSETLRQQLDLLAKELSAEKDISRKKISGLEEQVQRKIKENAEKDKFIKQFLIDRNKTIGSDNVQSILNNINSFFTDNNTLQVTTW